MYKKILIFILFFLPTNFALSAEQDIGIRIFNGKENVKISADDTISVSPLRIYESGKIYAIPLVDLTDPMASSVRIDTKSGIKSLKKFGGVYPYKNKTSGEAIWVPGGGWGWSVFSLYVDNSYNIKEKFKATILSDFSGACFADNHCNVTLKSFIVKSKTATVYLNPDGIDASSFGPSIVGYDYLTGWCNSLPSKPPVSVGESGWWSGVDMTYEFLCVDNKFYPIKDACQSGAISYYDLRKCVDYKYPPTPAGS
jgi:hypothetical protein